MDLLRELIEELVEARLRETDVTDGSRVAWGSVEHVSDLESRIADLERWRDRERRGSEARANYGRLITQLRRQLRSARRVNGGDPAQQVSEGFDGQGPEHSSIEGFAQHLLDDERDEYTHEDLAALNQSTRTPIGSIRSELDSYGFRLAKRTPEKAVRGFNSNSHDRWTGKGSMPTHGGAGIDPTTGRP